MRRSPTRSDEGLSAEGRMARFAAPGDTSLMEFASRFGRALQMLSATLRRRLAPRPLVFAPQSAPHAGPKVFRPREAGSHSSAAPPTPDASASSAAPPHSSAADAPFSGEQTHWLRVAVADAVVASIGSFAAHVCHQLKGIKEDVSAARFEAADAGVRADRAVASAGSATAAAQSASDCAAACERGTEELRTALADLSTS